MKASPAFALAEIMVAVVLATVVMLGLFAIFSSTFSFQKQGSIKDKARSGELMSLESMSRDLEAATYVNSPSSSTVSDQYGSVLSGCANFDPRIASILGTDGRIDGTKSVHAFAYCVDSNGKLWYFAEDNNTAAQIPALCKPATPYTCVTLTATGLPGGVPAPLYQSAPVVLAQPVSLDSCGTSCQNYFRRPVNVSDLVELHYVVGTSTSAATVNTGIAFVGALR